MKKSAHHRIKIAAPVILSSVAAFVFLAIPEPAQASCIYNHTGKYIFVNMGNAMDSRNPLKNGHHKCYTNTAGKYLVQANFPPMRRPPDDAAYLEEVCTSRHIRKHEWVKVYAHAGAYTCTFNDTKKP